MRRLLITAMMLVGASVGTSAQLPIKSPPTGIVMQLNDTVAVQYAVRNDGVLAPAPGGFTAKKCGTGLGFRRWYRWTAKAGWTVLQVDSTYAYVCGSPKFPLGVTCDSLAKVFKAAGFLIGPLSVTQDIQDANATCRKF